MRNNTIVISLVLFLQGICVAGFAQCPPPGGNQDFPEILPPQPEPESVDSATIRSEQPVDPNEIIGLEGYNAPESTDTLRWVSTTQSLAYTIYLENDAELAMSAASTSRFRKSFTVASLTCIHDLRLEIPLAHCVRGGMVRCADGRGGKRRAADENVPLLVMSFSPPFFFPFCLQVRHTIPRNVTALSGISTVGNKLSKNAV